MYGCMISEVFGNGVDSWTLCCVFCPVNDDDAWY